MTQMRPELLLNDDDREDLLDAWIARSQTDQPLTRMRRRATPTPSAPHARTVIRVACALAMVGIVSFSLARMATGQTHPSPTPTAVVHNGSANNPEARPPAQHMPPAVGVVHGPPAPERSTIRRVDHPSGRDRAQRSRPDSEDAAKPRAEATRVPDEQPRPSNPHPAPPPVTPQPAPAPGPPPDVVDLTPIHAP